LARGIRGLKTANRRERALGRRGILDPERGSSDMARQLLEGVRAAGISSRARARGILKGASDQSIKIGGLAAQGAGLEQDRRDEFQKNLFQTITQQRSDLTKRFEIARENLVSGLNLARSDITGNQAVEAKLAQDEPTLSDKIGQLSLLFEGLGNA